LNWFPRFFDISYVVSPAWTEAWSLRKVAHCEPSMAVATPTGSIITAFTPAELDFEKIASAQVRFHKAAVLKRAEEKAAEIDKRVPAEKGQDNLGRSPIKPAVYRQLKAIVGEHKDSQRALPIEELQGLKDKHSLGDILGGATACGIQLKKPEIEVLTDGDAKKLPDSLDFENPPRGILSVLKKWMPDRSLFDPPFAKRVIRIIRIKKDAGGIDKKSSRSSSAAYNKYCELLQGVDVDKLASKANEWEILEARSPNAVDLSLVNVKTAGVGETLRAVLPFVVGAGLHKS